MDKEKIVYSEDKAHYIVATAIIVKDGKYLIAKRADWEKHSPGKWTVPGGKLETKDYLLRECDTKDGKQWYNVIETLVRREVKEEVGLEIKETGYVTSLVYMRDDGIPTLVISLYANYLGGEVKLDSSMTEYKWVDVEEAKNYDLIDGIYDEIEILDRYLKGDKMRAWEKKI